MPARVPSIAPHVATVRSAAAARAPPAAEEPRVARGEHREEQRKEEEEVQQAHVCLKPHEYVKGIGGYLQYCQNVPHGCGRRT